LNVLEERDISGNLAVRYTYGYSSIYGIGSCVEIYVPGTPNKTYTLIMDHRGTAHVLLDESSAETGRRHRLQTDECTSEQAAHSNNSGNCCRNATHRGLV